jgi:hypothetical protein
VEAPVFDEAMISNVRNNLLLANLVAPDTLARVPMSRIEEADDLAGVALLSASPAGSFIYGQIIGVDGGSSAW